MRNILEFRSSKVIVPQPPTRGSIAPVITVFESETGAQTSVDYAKSNFTLIMFLRGTWCIYCGEQLRALQTHVQALNDAGIGIVCISPEPTSTLSTYKSKNGFNIPLFSDVSRSAAKAFGVHYWLRYDGFNLAHPALFIIGKSGETLVSYVSKSMADLPVGHLLDKFLSFLNQPVQETPDDQQ